MGKPTTYQNQVLDRTKVLYGPRTQTYGETNYLSKSSFGQNQGIAWSWDSNLWGNQLLIKIKFWIEPRYCIVLALKPMGKPTTQTRSGHQVGPGDIRDIPREVYIFTEGGPDVSLTPNGCG